MKSRVLESAAVSQAPPAPPEGEEESRVLCLQCKSQASPWEDPRDLQGVPPKIQDAQSAEAHTWETRGQVRGQHAAPRADPGDALRLFLSPRQSPPQTQTPPERVLVGFGLEVPASVSVPGTEQWLKNVPRGQRALRVRTGTPAPGILPELPSPSPHTQNILPRGMQRSWTPGR